MAKADSIPGIRERKNTIRLELVGRAPVPTALIYERELLKRKIRTNFLLGVGGFPYIPYVFMSGLSFDIPHVKLSPMLSVQYYGRFGWNGISTSDNYVFFANGGSSSIGLRYAFNEKFESQAFYTLLTDEIFGGFRHYAGLNFGYNF